MTITNWRWLADGVNRMAIGSVVNAMWDLWAKQAEKPLWKLLVDLPPEKIVQCIDWRYLRDALTPDEAEEILKTQLEGREEREQTLRQQGPKAYSTAGWARFNGRTDYRNRESSESRGTRLLQDEGRTGSGL